MRPAVYASVMRNRKPAIRRVKHTPHVFSWQRFSVLMLLGVVLFIPGLIVTILGLEHNDDLEEIPGDRVLFKFIGPVSLACGVCLVCSSGIYYCCWGVQSPVTTRRTRKHKKTKDHKDQYDPVQTSITAISNERKHAASPYSSGRSQRNSAHAHASDRHTGSAPVTPDHRSGRHGNDSHRYRSSSQSSTHSSRNHSHQNSRHRNTSHPHHSHSHNSHQNPTYHSHVSQSVFDNQVPFIHTAAPLAQGETGSMDISIDIDNVEDDKKY